MLLETPYFSITLNTTTGFLTSFYIKNPGLEILSSPTLLASASYTGGSGNPTSLTYVNDEFTFVFNSDPSIYCIVKYNVEGTWVTAEVIECNNIKSLYYFQSICFYDPAEYAIAITPLTFNTKEIQVAIGLQRYQGVALSGADNDCLPADVNGFPIIPIAGAKVSIIAGLKAEVIATMRSCALAQTVYPVCLQGGAFADTGLNRKPYLLALATKQNLPIDNLDHYGTVEEWIEICKDLNFEHFIVSHGNAQEGTFIPDPETVPGGMTEVQYVVQKFKDAGITVGMHCLSYWLAGDLAYAPGTKTGNTGVRIPDTDTETGRALLLTVADNLSNFYIEAGYNGELYFDGIDTYIPDYYRTIFFYRVLNNIKNAGLAIPSTGDAIGGIRGRYSQSHFWEWDTPHPNLPFVATHGAITNGPFEVGEVIRQSVTQWGTFVSDTGTEMTMVIDPASVQFEPGTLTGENSGATTVATSFTTNGLSFAQFVDYHIRLITISPLNIGPIPTLGWVRLGPWFTYPSEYTPTVSDYEYLFSKCTEIDGTYSLEAMSYVNVWRESAYIALRNVIRNYNIIPSNFVSPCITERPSSCNVNCVISGGNSCAKFIIYKGAYIPALTVCKMLQENRTVKGLNYANLCNEGNV